ncbi:MAG TPA: hypothetical protein VFO16_08115 [Pseudonocardiaceae bacterium]|nr:hypothetical protein [Pseudonocardiaceae bacterium]
MRARHEQVLTRRGATAKHVAKLAAAREPLDRVFYALRDGHVRRLGHTRHGMTSVRTTPVDARPCSVWAPRRAR